MKTTDLETVRSKPRQFTGGPIQEFYDVGRRYTIARYEAPDGEAFHVWVEGQDTCHGFGSLDAIALEDLREAVELLPANKHRAEFLAVLWTLETAWDLGQIELIAHRLEPITKDLRRLTGKE